MTTGIIKGRRSTRMPRREAAKDFRKSVVNVTVLKMIDLRRLSDMVKFKILQNLSELKKDPGECLVKMVLHDCNRKQICSLKPREWVDREVKVFGKASPLDKLYRYFLVENEHGDDFISCEKICVPIL
ncbi:hypothetical protein M9H77_21462 [Catharanthus roseus]|uniref:Uncharacterized protein n=1 Tax=Catharanthus roseus TaxID=4058 RepID=A0ACC0AMS9_CATRO|nr:hypothetical protein M9H77_21462 [Catharanthus roseus]